MIELLVVIGILAIAMGFILVAVSRARTAAQSTKCVAQLRNIGMAFIQFAADYQGKLPDPVMSNTSWESEIAPYLANNTLIFRCEADEEIYPAVGSSYDWRDTGLKTTTLAGKRITEVKRSSAVLAFEALPGWHAKKRMNAVRLDGSAENMDQEECLKDIATPVR